MNSEPTLTRIRKARQRISAKYGHDPEKLVDHYIELQKKYQDRLVPVNTASQENPIERSATKQA
jgi:thymidylate kinase